jgi:hypothetical protein
MISGEHIHHEISFDGLEVVNHDKREITFRGAAKPMLPPLVRALTGQLGATG